MIYLISESWVKPFYILFVPTADSYEKLVEKETSYIGTYESGFWGAAWGSSSKQVESIMNLDLEVPSKSEDGRISTYSIWEDKFGTEDMTVHLICHFIDDKLVAGCYFYVNIYSDKANRVMEGKYGKPSDGSLEDLLLELSKTSMGYGYLSKSTSNVASWTTNESNIYRLKDGDIYYVFFFPNASEWEKLGLGK